MTFHQPEPLATGVWRLRVHQPYHEDTNVYFFEGDEPTLFDSGHLFPSCLRELARGLGVVGLGLEDIARIIYTHPHIDHMGAGSRWPEPATRHLAHQDLQGVVEDYAAFTADWRGMTKRLLQDYPDLIAFKEYRQALSAFDRYFPACGRLPSLEPIKPGDLLQAGDYRVQVLATPGHSPYHLSYFLPELQTLIGGDLILDRGPALVSLTGDDINAYFSSLNKIAGLSLAEIWPAHGPLLKSPARAIEHSRLRVERNLSWVLNTLTTPKTFSRLLLEFAGLLGWPHRRNMDLSVWVGLLNTLVTYLENEGLVRRQRSGGQTILLSSISTGRKSI